MNLYGRMLVILIRLFFTKRDHHPLHRSRLFFHVWPHDCDFNLHLTSSRYFAVMDLCRIDLLVRMGLGRLILKKGWKFVVGAQEISYIREIPPFARFQVTTQIMGWDDKYFYIEHRVSRKGKLHALAHIRIAAIEKNRVISMSEIMEAADRDVEKPLEVEAITLWRKLLDHKKWKNFVQRDKSKKGKAVSK